MKPRVAILQAALTTIVVATCGCTIQSRPVAPTPQLVKQIGLPVYPNSKPQFGTDTSESVRSVGIHQLSAAFMTSDDLDRVARFYAQRVPKDAKRITIPLGLTREIAFQWYDKTSQKQVMLMTLKDKTMIQLQSMEFGSAPPPTRS